MIFGPTAALLFATILAQSQVAGGASPDLAAAKALYASAAYEEALSRLSTAPGSADAEQVEQYRALCFLALGRTTDAQRTLEQLVAGKPLYRITDADVSPRLVTMFHDVRKRLLPAAARDLYVKAKSSFDQKKYAAASRELKDLMAVLADADMPDQATGLQDLKLLAEGFLRLTDAELAAAKPVPVAPAEPASVAPPPPPPAARKAPVIYSAADAGVTPPVEIERRMPTWNPSSLIDRTVEYRGLLDVVIDERGAVESAAMRKSVSAFYDAPLLDAAKKWRFRPAKRNGEPVKYRKIFEVVLSPR